MATTKKSKRSKKAVEAVGQADPRSPLDSQAFLAAAKPMLAKLEADLVARAKASPEVMRALEVRYEAEKKASRTAEHLAGWIDALATQVAASWLLSCVFVRTLEDRGLLSQSRLAGPGAEDSQRQFFQLAPSLTERDYLLFVFRELAHHAAARDLFDAKHSLVWKLSPSAEVAKELLALFRAPSASEPAFRFGQPSTRFLGDLYQDLSEDVRKRYALLQTPDFVEAYILDHTLEPAIKRFGLDDTTLIDPTCGSGHFLLGAFDRLFEHRLRSESGIDARTAAAKAMNCVYGADINPFAVAIARFRLTLAFLDKAGYAKLADSPVVPLHLVVADSLRINPQHTQQELWQQAGGESAAWLGDVFALEDEAAAKDVLGRQYAAVVGNPPYVTVKDTALREVYRSMYPSCHRSYSLSVPFCERIFQLARVRGFTGQITANSFMKREFGKQLIEVYLPNINLEMIVNTSGAYIPGHGTPTVLLFGTNERPESPNVHAVLAKRGEPSTPEDPKQGLVWRSIADNDQVGFENDFISIAEVSRENLKKHPWSLGGGGASELKELLEERAVGRLSDLIDEVGRSTHTGEDGIFFMHEAAALRLGFANTSYVPLVKGEQVRDWAISDDEASLFPYDQATGKAIVPKDAEAKFYWRYRTVLKDRQDFGQKIEARGLKWFEHSMFFSRRYLKPLGIAFAFVATHNHFVLDRGGKVFKQSAPIIKLPDGATEDDHLALLAYLNSSTAAFFFRQAGHSKGAQGVNEGHKSEQWEQFIEYSGALVDSLPIPPGLAELSTFGREADVTARRLLDIQIAAVNDAESSDVREALFAVEAPRRALLARLCALQEAIDWRTYRLFGLIDEEPELSNSIEPGMRAFECELAATMPETSWFTRNRYQLPIGPAPVSVVQFSSVREISILEMPEFKHRWTIFDTTSEALEAVRNRRLSELEAAFKVEIDVRGTSEVVVVASACSTSDAELLEDQSIPFLSVLRFTESGQNKHKVWSDTWAGQRMQDSGEGRITDAPVPPRYQSVDYSKASFWQLRGKLDVPKERFLSYPFCESDQNDERVYGWAGWNHLQRAQALSNLYLKRRDGESWRADRLTPMLAGLLELIPWVKQWHNEPSDEFGGLRMGEYFEQFLDGECQQLGLTRSDLQSWRPPKRTRKPPGGKAATAELHADAERVTAEKKKASRKRLKAMEQGLESAKHELDDGQERS